MKKSGTSLYQFNIALGTSLLFALFIVPAAAQTQLSRSTQLQVTLKGSKQAPVWDAIRQVELYHDSNGWYMRIAGAKEDAKGYSVYGCMLKSANPATLFDIQRAILAVIPYEGIVSVRCGDAIPDGPSFPIVDLDDKRPGAATFYIVFGPR